MVCRLAAMGQTMLSQTTLKTTIVAALLASAAGLCACGGSSSTSVTPSPTPTPAHVAPQVVTVSGNQVLRDGVPWTPHAVQLVAFVAPPAAQTGAFAAAYAHYSTAELSAIKTWGADSIRFQISQPGADPQNALYDPAFVKMFVGAVKFARSIGLNAIVSIQDETQSGETAPTAMLPNDATNRVWRNIAPMLNGDNGIVYEMFNEPQPLPNAADWQDWAAAMNTVVQTIRATGATNTLLADGLNYAESLDGVIPLTDPPKRGVLLHPPLLPHRRRADGGQLDDQVREHRRHPAGDRRRMDDGDDLLLRRQYADRGLAIPPVHRLAAHRPGGRDLRLRPAQLRRHRQLTTTGRPQPSPTG